MKNFMKKTAFAALAALMALSAVSCGKTADGDGAETTAAQSGAAKAEPIVVQTNAYFAPFEYFEGNDMELVDWLRQYSAKKDDVYLRGFLGRMLFSNEDVFKPVNVLSGGEKVRCMLSRMMLSGANVVLLDQPTNHLDMESIQAVNKGLEAFGGVVLLASHDHEMLTSTCNRVIAFQPDGTIIDKYGTYDDYLAWMAERKGGNAAE